MIRPDDLSRRLAPAASEGYRQIMSKPVPAQPTRPEADQTDPVSPEVEENLRDRLKTFDADAKAARPWEDVLSDLKARKPLPPSPR